MQTRDVGFGAIIVVISGITYLLSQQPELALLTMLFCSISYLEIETSIILQKIKSGGLKFRDESTVKFVEYFDLIKWWLPIMLTLTFGITSATIALRASADMHNWVLVSLFMWAFSFVALSFTIFLAEIGKTKPFVNQMALNSLFLWIFIAVTGSLSGFIASFFNVPWYEDLLVSIFPLVIFEVYRLSFVRKSIFAIRFPSLDQGLMLLSIAEKEDLGKTISVENISKMRSTVEAYLQRFNALDKQENDILSEYKSIKSISGASKQNISQQKQQEIEAVCEKIKNSGESYRFTGPFTLNQKCFAAIRFEKQNDVTGYMVFDLNSDTFVNDLDLVKKIACCDTLYKSLEKARGKVFSKKQKGKLYINRLLLFSQGRLNNYFGKQFLKDLSDWLSSFDHSTKELYAKQIDLHITALLDYLLTRSDVYNSLLCNEYMKLFLEERSFELVSKIQSCQKRAIAVNEERIMTWERRQATAESLPAEKMGANYLAASSEKVKNSIVNTYEKWKAETQTYEKEVRVLVESSRTI